MPANTPAGLYVGTPSRLGVPAANQPNNSSQIDYSREVAAMNSQLSSDFMQGVEARQRKALAKAAKDEKLRRQIKEGTDYRASHGMPSLNRPFRDETYNQAEKRLNSAKLLINQGKGFAAIGYLESVISLNVSPELTDEARILLRQCLDDKANGVYERQAQLAREAEALTSGQNRAQRPRTNSSRNSSGDAFLQNRAFAIEQITREHLRW